METNITCPNGVCTYRNRVTGYCEYSGPCIEKDSIMEEMKMSEELIKNGYDQIIERVINRTVDPPKGKTTIELTAWLTGYADCQKAVINIIRQMKDQYMR